MKIRTTLFLALFLAGLGSYYFFSEKPFREAGAELAPIKILTLGEGDSLSFFHIENQVSKEMISLHRSGKEWMLDYPISYPAEKFIAEGMASALTFSQRLRRLPFKGDEKGLGFDSPKIKIGIETQKEPKRRTLLLGEASPIGGGVFARWEGEDEYFLISPEIQASFERSVYSLREKKLFRFPWDGLVWIQIKAGEKVFRLQKTGGKWSWTFPSLSGEIPADKVSDLVYSFQSLYVKEFLDGKNPDKKEFGLQAKGSFIAVGGNGGTEERLILGARALGKDALYVLREKENIVLLVSEKNLRSLLQMFEVSFQELKDANQGKTARSPGKDSKGLRKSQKRSR